MTTEKMPKRALTFMDHECGPVSVQFADGEGTPPKLQMVAYSGGVIKNHWYWDDLAIDLTGIQFQAKTPILEEHWLERKIAFTGKPITKNGKLETDPNKTQFVDTDESAKFQKVSKAGFPYQASIYATPSIVERISEGEKAQVNGFTMKGPGTIWRKCALKEISVCVFGYDSNTKAAAFAENEELELSFEQIGGTRDDKDNTERKEVTKDMPFDINKFKQDNPEEYKAFMETVKGEVKSEMQGQVDTLAKENTDLKKKLSVKETETTKMSERLDSLEKDREKEKEIQKERAFADQADRIWDAKLSDSDVAERLYPKVKAMVGYGKFVKDDVLDTQKFGEAIDMEIKDWETKGATQTVLGTGFSSKDEIDAGTKKHQALAAENKDTVNRLLALAGQPQKKAT